MSRRKHHVAKGASYPLASVADQTNDAAGSEEVSVAIAGDEP